MRPPPPPARRARLKPIDWILLALAGTAAAWFAWRVANLGNYRWNFAPIPQFFLRWDEASQGWVANILLHGLFNTVRLTIFGRASARNPFSRM